MMADATDAMDVSGLSGLNGLSGLDGLNGLNGLHLARTVRAIAFALVVVWFCVGRCRRASSAWSMPRCLSARDAAAEAL
jgi:hypothetical protein